MKAPSNLYETLEVSPRAGAAVIKAAYRCLVQLNHPDKHAGNVAAVERLAEINHAYSVLSDAQQRSSYDHLSGHAQPVAERRGGGVKTNVSPPAPPGTKRAVSRVFAFRPLKQTTDAD